MEIVSAVELVKLAGFPGVIFLIWYLYHRSQAKTLTTIIDQQAEREKNNFELLREMLETNNYHAAVLTRLEQQINNNQFCPIVRKETREEVHQ